MSRPSDWSALDHYTDPVPGSPEELEDGAVAMAQAATVIAQAAQNLREIAAADGQQSLAVDAFRERARLVAEEIALVEERYRRTADALTGYVEPLRAAQRLSEQALTAAVEARQRLWEAEAEATTASSDLQYAMDDAAMSTAQDALAAASARVTRAQDDLGEARTQLATAIGNRDDAAGSAMALIDAALEVNNLNDSGWTQFLNRFADVLDTVAKVLAYVGAALALVAMFVPGVNLLVLGIALGVGAAAINFALAQNGNKGWGDFVMDVVGVATLGAGKLVTTALRGVRASRAAQVANNRASVLAGPPARVGRSTRGGRPNHGRGVNRARRQRMAQGRAAQQAEYNAATSFPPTSLRAPSSYVQAAQHNIVRNKWNVVWSGSGDAYQMTYYNMVRAPGAGGGQAADTMYRLAHATGAGDNVSSVFGASALVPGNPVSSWAGDLVDPYLSNAPLQDAVLNER